MAKLNKFFPLRLEIFKKVISLWQLLKKPTITTMDNSKIIETNTMLAADIQVENYVLLPRRKAAK